MNIYKLPWRLVPNKIVRYPGGREIDKFRGVTPPQDDYRPEAWVGSDTRTVNADQTDDPNNGCAEVVLPNGERCYLFEAIQKAPKEVLGEKHIAINGEKMGVLVKLLDAERQLGLQCHPTRPYAKEHFNSDFGKEECWYVIGLRDDTEEPPYVLMGFKEGVTIKDFEEGYDNDDIKAMENCCHKVPVQVGDLFFIEAGCPHAIGGGCFVVEVQEPSDITVGATKPRYNRENMTAEELEEYKQRLLNCYIYDGADYETNLKKYKITPRLIRSGDWGTEHLMIGQEQTSYFSFTRIDANGAVSFLKTGFLQVMIVLEGKGTLTCGDQVYDIKKGDELFLPYDVDEVVMTPADGEKVSAVLCNPGQVTYTFEK